MSEGDRMFVESLFERGPRMGSPTVRHLEEGRDYPAGESPLDHGYERVSGGSYRMAAA
jgi:hypothetical protein